MISPIQINEIYKNYSNESEVSSVPNFITLKSKQQFFFHWTQTQVTMKYILYLNIHITENISCKCL